MTSCGSHPTRRFVASQFSSTKQHMQLSCMKHEWELREINFTIVNKEERVDRTSCTELNCMAWLLWLVTAINRVVIDES
jgi:hypothetical protein